MAEPARKRRRTNKDGDSVATVSEHMMGPSKKRKDCDGDALMSMGPVIKPPPQASMMAMDTDEKQQQQQEDDKGGMTAPQTQAHAPPSSSAAAAAAAMAGGPVVSQHDLTQSPSTDEVMGSGEFQKLFPDNSQNGGDKFYMFSQKNDLGGGGGMFKTEMDGLSVAGSTGLNASQLNVSMEDTDALFERAKTASEYAWKLNGVLYERHKREMAAKEEAHRRQIEDINTNHDDEAKVMQREYEQKIAEAQSQATATFNEYKSSKETYIGTITKQKDELMAVLTTRENELMKERKAKSDLERDYNELQNSHQALLTKMEGLKSFLLGGSVGASTSLSSQSPASSDGNPSKGPTSKKRRLSEI